MSKAQIGKANAVRQVCTRKSEEYLTRARLSVAGGVSSSVRLAGPPPPLFFTHALGAHLFDADGNRYIDYALGMGPNILGHAPPEVVQAVMLSLERGQLFAGTSPLEFELAEAIKTQVSSIELLRFGLSGSEMVQAALRAARAHTHRRRFIKFEGHYHGWFDNVLINHANTPSVLGADGSFEIVHQTAGQSDVATREAVVLPWNDQEVLSKYLERHSDDIAAVIMEPIMCNTGVIAPAPTYLAAVRALCDRFGVVLILDEVITGFRLSAGGAQKLLGVAGDLVVYAKAIAGGFPLAALGGKERIMGLIASGTVNHSGTYNGNLMSLAAGLATLRALTANEHAAYARIEATGSELIRGLSSLAKASGLPLRVQGFPSVFSTYFSPRESVRSYSEFKVSDTRRLADFLAALQERGVRPTGRGTWFVSAAHTREDVAQTLEAARNALTTLS